jgi:monoterpene epsilon-lactone hydrolase
MNAILSRHSEPWSATHPITAEDKVAMLALRAMVEPFKGKLGDSAGGTLALVLLRVVTERTPPGRVIPVGAVALSPVTDLTLTAQSWKTRAAADPYFIESQARELVRTYLNGADATAPKASPLYGDLTGLPPVRVHVGDDEVLLDDSLRYVARAVDAGVDARVDVQGMPHGFASGVGKFVAANQALAAVGAFLAQRLNSGIG